MLECSGKEIYLVCGATDMRKGLDGLDVYKRQDLCVAVSFELPIA